MFTIKARTATNSHYERSKNFAAAFSIYLLTPLESVKKTILLISLYYQLTLFIFTFVTCSVVVGTSSVQKNYALQFNGARLKGASNRILFVIEPKKTMDSEEKLKFHMLTIALKRANFAIWLRRRSTNRNIFFCIIRLQCWKGNISHGNRVQQPPAEELIVKFKQNRVFFLNWKICNFHTNIIILGRIYT